jgi:glycosyltransferase involved in cell wall biosynthesis
MRDDQSQPTLSVAIVVLNEEERLRACLESVVWADEIVVVDAGSSDKTMAIAREFTDRAMFRAWDGYGAQKNFALGQCRGDWLLSIDADERVPDTLREEIQATIRSERREVGYYLPRRNVFEGRWVRHGGLYPDWQLRLFRRGRGGFLERAVHAVHLERRRSQTGRFSAALNHESYRGIGTPSRG